MWCTDMQHSSHTHLKNNRTKQIRVKGFVLLLFKEDTKPWGWGKEVGWTREELVGGVKVEYDQSTIYQILKEFIKYSKRKLILYN